MDYNVIKIFFESQIQNSNQSLQMACNVQGILNGSDDLWIET